MAETTISSPSRTFLCPQLDATRLMPSVVPRTKSSSFLLRALRNRFILVRVSSYAAVERWLSSCTPRCMLAQSTERNLTIASITACGFCAVAALSRYTSGLPCMVCFRTGKSSRILATSKPAAMSVVSVLMEFPGQHLFQPIPQPGNLDAVDDILRERLCQQAARLGLANSARLQI